MKRSRFVGEEAEAEFDRWGRIESFEIQKLLPDTVGADRCFELPPVLTLGAGVGADEIGPATAGRIQIKGTDGEPKYAVAKLDNWKRFVDLPDPCFFLRVQLQDQEPVGATLLHVDEAVVEKVMRALRKLEGRDHGLLHARRLKVSWSLGTDLDPPFGKSFVSEVRRVVGDPRQYSRRKADWRDTVGYGEGSHRITFQAPPEEMLAHALGELPSIDATLVEHSTLRFDIPRTGTMAPGPVEVSFGTGVDGRLRAISETDDAAIEGAFRHVASVFDLDSLPPEARVWRWVSGPLTLVGAKSSSVSVSVALNESHTMRVWGEVGRIVSCLLRPGSKLEIITRDGRSASLGELRKFDDSHPLGSFGQTLWDFWRLIDGRGPYAATKVNGEEMVEQESRVRFATALSNGTPLTVVASLDEPMEVEGEYSRCAVVLATAVWCANHRLVFFRVYEAQLRAEEDGRSVEKVDATFEPSSDLMCEELNGDPATAKADFSRRVSELLEDLESEYDAVVRCPTPWLSLESGDRGDRRPP
ncbi:hypothetical protein N9917_03060 [Deltaproteobacteria bacterium]|nr:hypothetical protein [Deltaproteobacteria bacterium]